MKSTATRFRGFALAAIAAATYGLNPLFALPLYSEGLQAADVLFWRYIIGMAALLVMIRIRGQKIIVERKAALPLFGLGMLMGISSLLLFESYNLMPAGIASTLLFVYPIMVAIIMAVAFRERLQPAVIGCLVLAITGIALLNKGGAEGLSGSGTAMVMGSALTYALYLVFAVRGPLRDIPTLVLTFWVLLGGVALFAAVSPLHGGLMPPRSPFMWACALALGLVPTVISLVCTTLAVQSVGSTVTAILGALEPLTAVVVGISVFGESLSPREFVGLLLILTAVTGVVAADKVAATVLRIRKLFPRFYHLIKRHD